MKITVTFNMFRDMMEDEYPDAFTYDALHLLFNWLEMLEEGGKEQEFSPGDVYGEYSERELREFAKDYGLTYSFYEDEKEELTGEPPNVDELVTNNPPKEYEDFIVISNLLIRTQDELGQYRIITAAKGPCNPSYIKRVYLVTDIDYKYRGLALTKSEAQELGDLVALRGEEEIDQEEVEYDWETMDDEQVKEVVNEYLEARTCILGFTDATVVYQDF